MIFHPSKGVEDGWIRGIASDVQIQPNAIDVTLDKAFAPNFHDTFILSEQTKLHRPTRELTTNDQDEWLFGPGALDCMSDIYVEIPEGLAGYLIVRSTLNRNGCFVTSGLYDQGFKGNIGFMLHSPYGMTKITRGTRVAQFVLVRSDDIGMMYEGGYNTDSGKHWTE